MIAEIPPPPAASSPSLPPSFLSCLSRVCALRDETLSPAGAVHATNDNESRETESNRKREGGGVGCRAERDSAYGVQKERHLIKIFITKILLLCR